MSYDSASRRTSLALPNGVQTSYSYDPASRVTQILHQKAGAILEDVRYQYDATGSRTKYARTNPHPPLPSEAGATFDPANEMLSLNDKTFGYDFNGNLATRTDSCGTTTYGWDGRNRLTGISGWKPDCAPLTAGFKYDALGRRVEKTVNGVATQYLYDGLDVAAELQGGTTTAAYLRSLSIDEPFSRTKAGSTSYYLQDALGSVIGLADGSGQLVTTYAYDAFGGTTAVGAASDQPFKYTGREDDATGLYYYRARYYSPEMRRFVSEDPIGLKGGDVNYYAYVGNAPILAIDPTGLAVAFPCGYTWVGCLGVFGDINNQVIFCAPCGCKGRKWEKVHWADEPDPPPLVKAPAQVFRPSTPQLPLTTIDNCSCAGADKVYVNIRTRLALHALQYAWNARKVWLEYECNQ